MRKHIRTVLDVIDEAGLGVDSIEQGGKHTIIKLSNGERVVVGRGARHNPHIEQLVRQSLRRMQH
jgi:hypothetical protein